MSEKLSILSNYFSNKNPHYKRILTLSGLSREEITTALQMLKISTVPKHTVREWGNPCYVAIYDQNHFDGTFAIVQGTTLYITKLASLTADTNYGNNGIMLRSNVDDSKLVNTIAGGVYGGMLGAALGALTKTYYEVDIMGLRFKENSGFSGGSGQIIDLVFAKNEKFLTDSFKRLCNGFTEFYNAYVTILNSLNYYELLNSIIIGVLGTDSGIDGRGNIINDKKQSSLIIYFARQKNYDISKKAYNIQTRPLPFPDFI